MFVTNPELLAAPNIIKPLHGLNPRTIMWPVLWDRVRHKASADNKHHCMWCWVYQSNARYKKYLEAHEWYDIDFATHTYRLRQIVPLCNSCHMFIHSGLLSIMANNGTIAKRRETAILDHGNRILREAGINKMEYISNLCWGDFSLFTPEKNGSRSDWWLEVNGIKYYTKYPTYYDRARKYSS